jgi:hypothetical protein
VITCTSACFDIKKLIINAQKRNKQVQGKGLWLLCCHSDCTNFSSRMAVVYGTDLALLHGFEKLLQSE